MNSDVTTELVTGFIFLVFAAMVFVVAVSADYSSHEVDCFDDRGNKIIGLTCIDEGFDPAEKEHMIYMSIFMTLMALLCFAFALGRALR